jgi:hypothetical protein
MVRATAGVTKKKKKKKEATVGGTTHVSGLSAIKARWKVQVTKHVRDHPR